MNYTGNPVIAPAAADGDINSKTIVNFTVAAPTAYNFSGSASSTQPDAAGCQLTRTDPTQITFNDDPCNAHSGTLQPGSSEYSAGSGVGNQLGIPGTLSDSFNCTFPLKIGS